MVKRALTILRAPRGPLSYERNAFQFLSVYRFFTFAIAVILLVVLPLPERPSGFTYFILVLLGGYTILKVIQPFHLYERAALGHALLALDVVACLGLTLASGGVESPLLLYSLSPLLTAALLFQPRAILPVAAASAGGMALGHLALDRTTEKLAWVLEGNILSILVIYSIVCFVIAALASRTNINVYRRIESMGVLQERQRLARELHDSLAQSLGFLKWRAKSARDSTLAQDFKGAVEALGDIKSVVDELYEDVRGSIDLLSTGGGDGLPVASALAQHVQDFSEKSGIQVEFSATGDEVVLSPLAGLQLVRIVQEALNNVGKHSGAARAWVSLRAQPGEVEVEVGDDGRGFSPSEGPGQGYHGLQIMRDRAQNVRGSLSLVSAPGQGTQVIVRVPQDRVRRP